MKKIAFALMLPLLALACTDGAPGDQDAEAPEDVLMQDTLPDDAVAPDDPSGAITVVLEEWTIRPARDTIPAPQGTTTFRVRNSGEYPHILEVEGQGEEWVTDTIPPGDWVTLDTELRSGTYELYCPIAGDHGDHDELGMRTPLVVR